MENKSILRRFTDKLFGGIDMKWWKVIVFAVAAAAVTFVFLFFPVFENTSFSRMGVYFDAWILFAVIIMSNCKKPLESALKTFVFFLVSQPLIYLFQVPFSHLGWQIFSYYRYWFFWTLLTFPMAFAGWFIRKKNWLSLPILSPVLVYLTVVYVSSFRFTVSHFPYQLAAALFCLAQVILYLYTFTPRLWQRLTGFFVPLATVVIFMLATPQVQMSLQTYLPDEPVLTEKASAVCDNTDMAVVTVSETGKDSTISIECKQFGATEFVIKDGDKEYRYLLEVYEDEGGHPQTRITPVS